MKTRKLTFAIISIFVSAVMFVFASCVETVDESVVSDTVDPSVTEVTSENNEAAQAQDAAAAAAESAETPDTETVLPQDNAAAEAEETPEAGADQTVIVE